VNTILGIGCVLFLGLFSSKLAEKLKTPAITAYLILGIILGPFVFGFIPQSIIAASGLISNIALSLIAFSIGQSFSKQTLRQVGSIVMWISVLSALGACIAVVFSMKLMGVSTQSSLLLGAIATATAPAAIIMVVREYKARGTFVDILMGVVALDDAWGLIIFSFSLAIARALHFQSDAHISDIIKEVSWEIIGSFVAGALIGFVLNKLSRVIKNQTELLIFTLALIFITTGVAIWLHLSVLLSCMVMAAVVVNMNNESFKYFQILQTVDWPIYLFFFVLAGANLEIHMLSTLSLVGVVYLITRMLGKWVGTLIGAYISKADKDTKKYLSLAQMPQAGVALGMALIVKSEFSDIGSMIFTTAVAATVVYELIGPYFVKLALQKSGQIQEQA
jgi:NhaP-type Na+/H+ or K+/H+ antiporter